MKKTLLIAAMALPFVTGCATTTVGKYGAYNTVNEVDAKFLANASTKDANLATYKEYVNYPIAGKHKALVFNENSQVLFWSWTTRDEKVAEEDALIKCKKSTPQYGDKAKCTTESIDGKRVFPTHGTTKVLKAFGKKVGEKTKSGVSAVKKKMGK